jgi:hypothetical protein
VRCGCGVVLGAGEVVEVLRVQGSGWPLLGSGWPLLGYAPVLDARGVGFRVHCWSWLLWHCIVTATAASGADLARCCRRVVCMSCGANTCRHELQAQLAQLNPEAAWSAQLIADQRSRLASWQRALRAGTAADARAVTGADTEQVGRCCYCCLRYCCCLPWLIYIPHSPSIHPPTTQPHHASHPSTPHTSPRTSPRPPPQLTQVPVRRPDGDVELRDAGSSFIVPPCSSCGGILKPDVVFFGDTVPKARVLQATQLCESADTLLVVGSSLMVFSAYRLARAAKDAGAKLVSINVGPTRADNITDFKLELLAGEVLMALASHPSMLLPRV